MLCFVKKTKNENRHVLKDDLIRPMFRPSWTSIGALFIDFPFWPSPILAIFVTTCSASINFFSFQQFITQAKKLAEKEAVKKNAEEVKKAAEALEKSVQEIAPLPTVLSTEAPGSCHQIPILDRSLSMNDMEKPFIMKSPLPAGAADSFLAHKMSQAQIAKWASGYKKNQRFIAQKHVLKRSEPPRNHGFCYKVFETNNKYKRNKIK